MVGSWYTSDLKKYLQQRLSDTEEPTESNSVLPREVKTLHIEKPVTENQKFCNNVVIDIYEFCYGVVKSATFIQYATNQREWRYVVNEKCFSYKKTLHKYQESTSEEHCRIF